MSSRIEQIIEEIEEYVESCKYQPLSTTKIVVNKEELEELPEGELNFHREIWQNYPYSLFRKDHQQQRCDSGRCTEQGRCHHCRGTGKGKRDGRAE